MAITYTDKVQNAVNPLPVTEQFRAIDANEIKNEVNANITATAAAQLNIDTHESLTNNPHSVTATQVGLGNVPNLSFSGSNTGDQTAATVPNTPAGNISATDVQAAINELDTEKSGIPSYTAHAATFTGLAASPTPVFTCRYHKTGTLCHIYLNLTVAVSNASTFQFILPFAAANTGRQGFNCYITNNGTPSTAGLALTNLNSTTMDIFRDAAGTGFTASGTKLLILSINYETV